MRVKNATKIDEHSYELPKKTVVLGNENKVELSQGLLSNLKDYLNNGGGVDILSKYLS